MNKEKKISELFEISTITTSDNICYVVFVLIKLFFLPLVDDRILRSGIAAGFLDQ